MSTRAPVSGTGRPSVDPTTARVLGELQSRFPLVERPYAEVGERLGLTEQDVLARMAMARSSGHIRQVSAIFDTESLGYHSSLVAMRVPGARLARAVSVINAHPGVSHNYLREHDFNLWFTIATPPQRALGPVLDRLLELSGADAIRALPTLRLFKIGVTLDATGHTHRGRESGAWYSEDQQRRAAHRPLTDADIEFVRAAQADLSHEADPFEAIGRALQVPAAEVVDRARQMVASGHLRRFAAILDHRRAGFGANGMAVWRVPEDRIEEVGRALAAQRSVSHCYQRPAYPDWPYNIFTMVHGSDRDEVETAVAELAEVSGIEDRRVLYSTTEFKKVRLAYFMPTEDRWLELCTAASNAPHHGPAEGRPLATGSAV